MFGVNLWFFVYKNSFFFMYMCCNFFILDNVLNWNKIN